LCRRINKTIELYHRAEKKKVAKKLSSVQHALRNLFFKNGGRGLQAFSKKISIQMIALIAFSRLIAMKEHQTKRKEQQ